MPAGLLNKIRRALLIVKVQGQKKLLLNSPCPEAIVIKYYFEAAAVKTLTEADVATVPAAVTAATA
jgi:hypothetical protein